MGQDEPEPIKPDGEDPGTLVTEGDQPPEAPAVPEGPDPGQEETFSLE